MSANFKFINRLPEKFTRKELLKMVVKESGYSVSKANNIIEYGLIIGILERIEKGVYKKVEINGGF